MLHSLKATATRAVLLAIPILGAWPFPAQAQTAYQVKDIVVEPGSGPSSSDPSDLIEFSNTLYFLAEDPANGRELWRSDGTPAGTRLLKDLLPGAQEPSPLTHPHELVRFKNALFFEAGQKLWKSDGTTAGTVEVASFSGDVGPSHLNPADSVLYFMLGFDLWKSDGTPAGTSLVQSVGDVRYMVAIGSRVFAFVGWGPTDLWVSDGTGAGTSRVAQVCSTECEAVYSFSRNAAVEPIGGALFFAGQDSASGTELWKSDGTPSGTGPVTDLVDGPAGSSPRSLAGVAGTLFFSAADASLRRALWVSDGTASGTRKVKDVLPDGISSVNGTAYFYGLESSAATGWEPWRSDGTEAGTTLVKDVCPGGCSSWDLGTSVLKKRTFYESGGRAYFTSQELEVWSTDGTAGGTRLTYRAQSRLRPFRAAGSPKFYFAADRELWITDGSLQAPVQLTSATGDVSSNPLEVTRLNEGVYFSARESADSAYPRKLWYSSGDAPNTSAVFNGGDAGRSERHTPFRGKLLFVGQDPPGLWVADRPDLPARRLTDGFIQGRIVVSNLRAFFGKAGGLWVTDGTVGGTRLVVSIPNNGSPDEMTAAGNFVFFTMGGPGPLWRTDGTPQGTILVRSSPAPSNLFAFQGTLYFSELPSLWKSDGTPEGTVLAVPDAAVRAPVKVVGTRFFYVREDSGGFELWRSDGTVQGTARVKDIRPGPAGSLAYAAYPNSPVMSDRRGILYFVADDGTHGLELWRSDGTESGTVLVKDIAPGHASSAISDLINIYGTLYMSASDGLTGREVWRSDGTTAGTYAVEDIAPGVGSSNPALFTPAGRTVFFTANDGETGNELWAFPVLSHDVGLLSAPAPGGTLTSTTATWTWYPGDETLEYWLTVENLTTGQVLYDASQGTGLSRTVAGLPLDGGMLLVRLWSRLPQGWRSLDYTYTAGLARPATMVTPVPGAALSSSVVTFNWEAGVGATAYRLYVGTTPGGVQIYPGSQVTDLSATVSGVPTTGATVYVRLFSLIGGLWQQIDYSYTTGGPASLTVSATTVQPGQAVQVTLQGGPGNLRDWVGLHSSTALDTSYLDWKYLNGTRTVPTSGLSSAALTFTMPTTAGTYSFRFFQNGGYAKLATSPTVTVGTVVSPVLNVTPASLAFGDVAVGTTVDKTVVVKNTGVGTLSGTGSVTGTGYSLIGTPSYSLTANQEMTLTVRFAPTAMGSANGTLTLTGAAGTAVPVTGNGTSTVPSLTIVGGVSTVAPGATLQLQVSNGPGFAKDWVGLHAIAAADNTYLDWKYLSGTRTVPVTGVTNATLTFTMPTTPGTYEFRFFQNNTYARLATSPSVAVAVVTTPTLTVSATTATPGQAVPVTLQNGPRYPKDWIALAATGAGNTSYSSWFYLNGTRNATSVGVTAATIYFTMPTTPGTYEFRFFQNNTYTRLATSPTVTVQ